MGSVTPAGGAHTAATWYDWEDGRFLLSLDHSRVRLSYIRAERRVSLTVLDRDDWYRHISLIGVAEQLYVDDGLADADRLAIRYTGMPYLTRDSTRVSVWVRVKRWHGWDASNGNRVTDASWR